MNIRPMTSCFRCCFSVSSTSAEVGAQDIDISDISRISINGQETNSRMFPTNSDAQRNSRTLNSNEASNCTTPAMKEDGDGNNSTNSAESAGLIGGRWKLGELLGTGEYGEVFRAVDTETEEEVFVKMEPIPKDEFCRSRFPMESDVLRTLNATAFAKMLFHGRVGDRNALVMTRLGRSLAELQELCAGKFTAKTVLMIGIQAVTEGPPGE